ncbi:MAG: HAD-IC family P-type ATPase [Anaerolineae bacterium]|nr:HAD-IC family P-type ATPase [Anaerolineae bacterium]
MRRLNEMDFISGLDEDEVRTRRERGEGNASSLRTSRSVGDILRQNIFTLINVVLFSLGAVMVSIGRVSEGLTSVSIIFMNVVVGVFQEIRAKRQLDKIALLTRPKVTVMREGQEKTVDPAEIVRGDVLVVRPGDQIVVDGIMVGDGELEVDESLLTGESDHIPKKQGDSLLSGSFVVTGSALFVARRVGDQSFANKLAAEARTFRVVQTPLQRDVDFVIRVLMLVAIIFALLLGVSAWLSDVPFMRGVQMATVVAGLVPNGLFFMVIVAYALGTVRIADRGALIQQANSVESLSNVDVLCMDKTGTLTANLINYHDVYPVGIDQDEFKELLGVVAHNTAVTNRTSGAIIEALPGEHRRKVDEVPFSSSRKWSAIAFNDPKLRGVYVLGALEMLRSYLPDTGSPDTDSAPEVADLVRQAGVLSEQGLRVLLFAYNPNVTRLHDDQNRPVLPALLPLGLISFSDELRGEAKETLAGFVAAGIQLKVISGDSPHTVAALAKQAGLPGALRVISGPELVDIDGAQFETIAEEVTVFGRIRPEQKEQLVDALRSRGYYVAMIGDGVNDVLSLKKANLGIAMQSGSGATRGVADMVLLGDSFAALPPAFMEGQRINSGMRDILRLYLTRAVGLVMLIMAVSVAGIGFPYTPKHVTLAALITVGIPTMGIAMWARSEKAEHGLLLSVIHFALPAGILVFVAGFLLYVFTFNSFINEGRRVDILENDIESFQTYAGINYEIYTEDEFLYEVATLYSQTVLTVFTMVCGLMLILFVEPPTYWFAGGDKYSGDIRPTLLAGSLLGVFAIIMAVPSLRQFWELLALEWTDYALIAGVVVIWMLLLRYAWRANWFERFLHIDYIEHASDEWV